MKKQLLFCAVLGALTACQNESEIQPNTLSLAGEVTGVYQTNFFIDPSCIAVPSNKMPFTEVKAESDSAVTLIYTRQFPNKEVKKIEHIALNRQSEAIQLKIANVSVGSIQTDRMFTDNGMEKEGKVLRLTIQNSTQVVLMFTGYKH